jgi:hypothetical protein
MHLAAAGREFAENGAPVCRSSAVSDGLASNLCRVLASGLQANFPGRNRFNRRRLLNSSAPLLLCSWSEKQATDLRKRILTATKRF